MPLFEARSELEEKTLFEDLLKMQPLDPRLGNYVYTLSSVSLRKRIVGKFVGSRSVTQAVVSSTEEAPTQTEFRPVLQKFDDGAIGLYKPRLQGEPRPLDAVTGMNTFCLFEIAQSLRERTWDVR